MIKHFITKCYSNNANNSRSSKFSNKRIFIVKNGKRKLTNSLQLMKLINFFNKEIEALQC